MQRIEYSSDDCGHATTDRRECCAPPLAHETTVLGTRPRPLKRPLILTAKQRKLRRYIPKSWALPGTGVSVPAGRSDFMSQPGSGAFRSHTSHS